MTNMRDFKSAVRVLAGAVAICALSMLNGHAQQAKGPPTKLPLPMAEPAPKRIASLCA